MFMVFVGWKMRQRVYLDCCGQQDAAAREQKAAMACAALLYQASRDDGQHELVGGVWRKLKHGHAQAVRGAMQGVGMGAHSVGIVALGAQRSTHGSFIQGGSEPEGHQHFAGDGRAQSRHVMIPAPGIADRPGRGWPAALHAGSQSPSEASGAQGLRTVAHRATQA